MGERVTQVPAPKHLRRSVPDFRYKRYKLDDGRHRGDTERTYGGTLLQACKPVRKHDQPATNRFCHAALSRSRVKHPVAKRLNRVYPETFKCDAGIQKVIAEERARASDD